MTIIVATINNNGSMTMGGDHYISSGKFIERKVYKHDDFLIGFAGRIAIFRKMAKTIDSLDIRDNPTPSDIIQDIEEAVASSIHPFTPAPKVGIEVLIAYKKHLYTVDFSYECWIARQIIGNFACIGSGSDVAEDVIKMRYTARRRVINIPTVIKQTCAMDDSCGCNGEPTIETLA